MSVILTERAAAEIKRIMDEQGSPDGTLVRVGVKGGGCSGFSYDFGWDTETSERDRVREFHGVRLAMDKKYDPYLDGTEIDFIDEIGRRGFAFNNPNVQKSCGCGSSFQV